MLMDGKKYYAAEAGRKSVFVMKGYLLQHLITFDWTLCNNI